MTIVYCCQRPKLFFFKIYNLGKSDKKQDAYSVFTLDCVGNIVDFYFRFGRMYREESHFTKINLPQACKHAIQFGLMIFIGRK